MSIAETLTGFIPATPARREAKRAAAVARAVADAEERTHALLRRRLLDSHLSAGQLVKLAAGAFGTIDVERVTRGERVPHAVAAAMVPSLFAGMTLTDAWEIKPAPGNRGPNANVPQDRPTAPAPATDSSTGAPSPDPYARALETAGRLSLLAEFTEGETRNAFRGLAGDLRRASAGNDLATIAATLDRIRTAHDVEGLEHEVASREAARLDVPVPTTPDEIRTVLRAALGDANALRKLRPPKVTP